LAIKLSRQGFEEIISKSVSTSLNSSSSSSSSREEWKEKLKSSEVRIQWDPDHNLKGEKMERRAIQLGMKGDILKKYSDEYIISIEDITEFVSEQYELIKTDKLDQIVTPVEQVYVLGDLGDMNF
jgi:hypothetical protein